MTRARRLGVVLASLLVVSTVGPTVAVSAAASGSNAGAAAGYVFVTTETTPTQPVADENFTLSVSLASAEASNGGYVVKRVAVRENRSAGGDLLNDTRNVGRIEPGGERTASLSVEVEDPGEETLFAHLRVQGPQGETVRLVHPVTVHARETHPVLSLSAAPSLSGAKTNVTVSLANGRDGPVRNVDLRVRAADDVAVDDSRRVRSSVPPGNTTNFTFATTGDRGRHAFRADLSYVTENGSHRSVTRRLSTVFAPPENPGNVSLTGLNVSREGDALSVSGTAGNVGGTNVTGAVVRVAAGAEGVGPASTNADYFLGTVEESEFASFEVLATLPENATRATVPLEVVYRVDGVTRTERVTVSYEAPDEPTESASKSGLLSVSPALVGAGAAALLVVGGVWRWRRGGR